MLWVRVFVARDHLGKTKRNIDVKIVIFFHKHWRYDNNVGTNDGSSIHNK